MPQPSGSEARWKPSRYLTRVELPRQRVLLLFGGIGSRLIEVPAKRAADLDRLLAHPSAAETDGRPALQVLLREQGLLVPESFDEVAYLERLYRRARAGPARHLGLTICPTLGCNFRCSYCYQHHGSGSMAEAVQDRLVDFVRDRITPATTLSVVWYGGEPLLARRVIERLSSAFMSPDLEKAGYDASIVTNGSMLTPAASRLLTDLEVREAQVTLDGPREVHDRRRPLQGGHPTFDRILANISRADPRLRITIRVNVDRENATAVPALLAQLDAAGLKGRVGVYFAAVRPYTEVCADVAERCMQAPYWPRLQSQLQLMAQQRGYGGLSLPASITHHCMADGDTGWLIDPDGLVFKCWNEVSEPHNAVFDLAAGQQTPKMQEVAARWQAWNAFGLTECTQCAVLPLCLGGCPSLGMKLGQPHARGSCMEVRDNLRERIAIYYLGLKRREAAQQLHDAVAAWIPEVERIQSTSGQLRQRGVRADRPELAR